MSRPSFEVQAQGLAELFCGAAHTACELTGAAILQVPAKVERVAPTAFTITTQSGTVLECRFTVINDGD